MAAAMTVYGSLDSSQTDRVVVVAIKKATSGKTVGLKLAHPTAYGSLAHYELSGVSPQLTRTTDVAAKAENAWVVSLPAQSVAVLVPQP